MEGEGNGPNLLDDDHQGCHMAGDRQAIYRAGSVEEPADRLDEFERNRAGHHPSVVRSWRANWEIIPMFGLALEVRRLLYTANAIESLHRDLCKAIKTRPI